MAGIGPSIKGIDHVVLRVRDLARAVTFYQDVLGLKEEMRIERIGLAMMRAGFSMIDLQDAAKAPPLPDGANMEHYCVQIEAYDPAELYAYLDAKGVKHGEVAMRFGADGQGPSVYIEDPDGNTVELKGPAIPG
jgi:glyoxylase I family protein